MDKMRRALLRFFFGSINTEWQVKRAPVDECGADKNQSDEAEPGLEVPAGAEGGHAGDEANETVGGSDVLDHNAADLMNVGFDLNDSTNLRPAEAMIL